MKSTIELIYTAVNAAVEKKGENIVVLDLQELNTITDYFVIITSQTPHQTEAIVENIDKAMSEEGLILLHKEGEYEGGWMILDYDIFVVHIMGLEERNFYNLERLWSRARRVKLPDEMLIS
jgi:ribosome-associated protein